MPENHKFCCVIFDEMAITPRILYDKTNDKLSGFIYNGTTTEKKKFGNHVLVFMLRGIIKNINSLWLIIFVLEVQKLQN